MGAWERRASRGHSRKPLSEPVRMASPLREDYQRLFFLELTQAPAKGAYVLAISIQRIDAVGLEVGSYKRPFEETPLAHEIESPRQARA